MLEQLKALKSISKVLGFGIFYTSAITTSVLPMDDHQLFRMMSRLFSTKDFYSYLEPPRRTSDFTAR
jgi:hypothetical protein